MKPQTNQNSTVRLSTVLAPSPVIAKHKAIRESRWLSGGVGLLLLLFTTLSFAQTWQWGKGGGGSTNPDVTNEYVNAIATDAQNNIYVIADVGPGFLKVDGVAKEHYGIYPNVTNGVLASFSCNGTYRWSKVIGGQDNSYIYDVKTDATGNVYVVGFFSNPVGINPPNTFDGEFNVPLKASAGGGMVSNFYTTYFAKYSNIGVLQWVKFPENTVVPSDGLDNLCTLTKIEIDAEGNFHILAFLSNGTFFNGLYTNNFGNSTHVLKYDSQGNFVSGVRLNVNLGAFALRAQFKRDPNSGAFYFSGTSNPIGSQPATLGGIPFTKTTFLAKFSPTGAFLWKQENTDAVIGGFFANTAVGFDGSVYFQANTPTQVNDSFAGQSFPVDNPASFSRLTYIMKFTSDGQPIWSSNSRQSDGHVCRSIGLNGNEVAVPMTMANLKWGHQELFEPAQNRYDAGIVRLNKNTGELITISKIPSFTGTKNVATRIAADALGNYYVGGGFSSILYPGSSTINTAGGDNDFFVAKYGTSNCNCQLPTCSFRALNTTSNLNILNFRYYGQEVYTSVSWNFGDGTPLSTQVNPTHTFAQPGIYNVCLTATNACGTQTFCSNVNTSVLGIKDQKLEVANLMTLAPNPANTFCRIDYEVQTPNAFITIYDLNGRLIEQHNIKDDLKGSWKINVSSYPVGVYLVTVQIPGGALMQRKLNVVR